MKLTIKTLSQVTFKMEVDPEKSVKELKEQIERDHGKDYPIAYQKLIYNGKILADESKVAEYDVDEKKFVVLMIARPPPPPKPAAAPPTPSTTTPTTSQSTTTEKTPTNVKKEEPKSLQPQQKGKVDDRRQSKQTSTTTTLSQSSSHTLGAGTAPSPVVASAVPLRSNDPTTPANLSTATTTTSSLAGNLANAPRRPRNPPRPGAPTTEQSFMSSRLANIMNQPQFRLIQELIQQSPHLISPTIESLASTDPEMYSFISENPDIFVTALNQPPMSLNLTPSSRGSSTTGSSTGGGGQQQQPPTQQQQSLQTQQQSQQQLSNLGARSGVVEIPNVSQHDKEAIERLKELGFSEYQAYQAYIACDKDEQLAANLLFQMDQ